MISINELARYGRQIAYPRFGKVGQEKLRASHVLVVGVGGLGSAASIYLAYAGIGHITIVDNDSVELSNLNRQILHWESDLGEKKAMSAANKLRRINSSIQVTPVCKKITEASIDKIVDGADVVIDGLDNYDTRFLVNAACVRKEIPFIHAGVNGLLGQITTIIPGKTPCLACIYSEPPDTGSTIPVFGATPSLMASMQVMEAIKFIAGFGKTLGGRMLYFNGETMEFAHQDLVKNPKCSICGSGRRKLRESRK